MTVVGVERRLPLRALRAGRADLALATGGYVGMEDYAAAVALTLEALQLEDILAAIRGTWILGKSRAKFTEKIDEVRLELERKIDQETDIAVHDFGETVSAIRAKINEMELWNRDTFVTKATFNLVAAQNRDFWQRFEDKLDRRLDRIELKLDKNEEK